MSRDSATPPSGSPIVQNPSVGSADISVPFTKEEMERSIPDRFEEIVRRLPDQIAIKMDENVVTYAQLNADANRFARSILTQAGHTPEPIGVLLGRGSALPAAMLAVLKAGKFFVPLDPSFPKSRIAATLEDSQATLLITDRQNVGLAREVLCGSCRLVVEFESSNPLTSADDLRLPITPSSLACIVYTSGSTGQSKGVVLDHRGLLHNGMLQGIVTPVGVRDRVTLLTSGTANAISTTFFTLFSGATLLPFDVGKEGVSRMAEWLSRERISIALIASPLFRRFCASLRGEESFPDVRLLRLTSESVYRTDLDLYKRHFSPNCTFVNGLNSTEMGPVSACNMDHRTVITENDVPVGYPLTDKKILLLDEAGNEVGLNESGEIAVTSRYLSRGYWRRPDLTKAKFKPDPEGGDEVLYLTGDLGLMLPDGRLVHKGRKDFRVKIRGYGVDLVEVQKELLSHPDIDEAIVVPLKSEMAEFYLVAYFTSRVRPAPDVSELRGFLKAKLATYMIPSYFVTLNALPLTPNGKINRAALPIPDRSRPDLDKRHASPGNAVEAKLLQIWGKVLGVHPIGITDDFFALGGDSLAAVSLIAALEVEFNLDLVVGILVNAPTIESLARHIEAERKKCQRRDGYLLQLQPGDGRRPIFLIPGGIGGDGEFFVYARLARHVGSQYPFYGLKARSAQGTESSQSSVKEIASDYVGAMQSLQAQGPYYVVGECSGGIVAYEIAQQLHEVGQEIPLLILMDTSRPDLALEVRRRLNRFFRPILTSRYITGLSFLWGQLRQRTVRGKARYLVEKGGKIVRKTLQQNQTPPGEAIERRIEYVQRTYSRAIYAYRPRPYPGKMTLLVHEESQRDDERATLGWKDLVAGGIELHVLPGSHLTYIRDHVHTVASRIRECIERAEATLSQRVDPTPENRDTGKVDLSSATTRQRPVA